MKNYTKQTKRLIMLIFFILVIVVAVTTAVYIFLTSRKRFLQFTKIPMPTTTSSRRYVERNVSSSGNILMLYWGFPWNQKSYVPPEGPSGDGCEVTHRRARIAEARVVIFHYSITSVEDIPWRFYRWLII